MKIVKLLLIVATVLQVGVVMGNGPSGHFTTQLDPKLYRIRARLFLGPALKRPLIREDLNVLQTSVPGG